MSPPNAQKVTDPRIGELIDDRYRLLAPLGRGGMGAVYRAEHTAIRNQVALKLLAPRMGNSSDADRQRFEREAFATGRLKHPNCVAITDFGALDDGTLYLAMELLDGATLSSLLADNQRLPVPRALHITKHILAGLAHAHDLGVVHRDLKPQNVMLIEHLGDPDFAKVLDFGLAKLLGEAELAEGGGKLTAAGITFGTPHYMSPEQAFGKPVDHRADLYAASVMLFELLAGSPPFDDDDPRSVLTAHATRAVPRIHEVCRDADVPVEVEMLIRQGLAKDPRDRMASARDMGSAVEKLLAGLEQKTTSRLRVAELTPRPELRPPVAVLASSPSAAHASDETAAIPGAPALVPAPATAAPPRRAVPWRWIGVAGGAAAMIATLAVLAASSGDGEPAAAAKAAPSQPDSATDSTATSPAEPPEIATEPVTQEIERALTGSYEQAKKDLEALRKQHPTVAAIPYAQGNFYYDRPWPPMAIKAYRDAIDLDDSYRSDERIIVNLLKLLSSHSARYQAGKLLERMGEPTLPYLDQTAADHGNPKVRARAAAIARRIRGK